MWKFYAGVLTLLLMVAAVGAQEKKEETKEPPASAAEQLDQLISEHRQALSDFLGKYREAKTDEEKQKLVEELYPRPEKFAERFMELAAKNADDPVALKALSWVVSNAGYSPSGQKAAQLLMDSVEKDPTDPAALNALVLIVTQTMGPNADKAGKLLVEHHMDSEQLGQVCWGLIYSRSEGAQDLLRQVLDKSPHKNVKGQACLALGKLLMETGEAGTKEAESLLERVVNEFADVEFRNRSLAKWAEGDLFEIRNLQIGMVAPDIEGEDVDGVQLQAERLSRQGGRARLLGRLVRPLPGHVPARAVARETTGRRTLCAAGNQQ